MKKARVVLVVFSMILFALSLVPEGMLAQDANRAALVIRTGDQNVQSTCVEFNEPEISGLEILQRSGLDIKIDVQSMGAKVCSIEQTGCPADDCWCQCKGGGDCVYWSYWHRLNGQWEYALGGASVYSIRDGDVEGWSWGPGSVTDAFPPPDITFTDVCASSAVLEDTATPTATTEPVFYVPGDEPTSEPTQAKSTANTAPATPQTTATTAATLTAIPTITALPSNTPTAVPVPTQTPEGVAAAATAVPAATEVAKAPEAAPVVEEAVVPDPVPSPLPPAEEAVQPAPEVEVGAVAQAVLPTRPQQRDIKNLVATAGSPDRELTVIGSAVEVVDMGPQRIEYETHIAAVESESGTTSWISYAIFSLIVLGLTGLLLLSSLKRRAAQG